ncbi:FISUMP domain-containing protein [uncultured Fibrobacter sp.]|uniref:FISUMP domain-containing protein n=1 Tax=uncultured Fibrobacter sp. TaxID=261512 RepID=UPI00260E9E4D|nr:FISUMP domain-containing protein [uncultured Fibrobacter sp.]
MKISKTSFAVKSLGFASVLVGILLAACGEQGTTENITQINQIGMEVVSSVKDLPKCTKDNEGELALVKGETSVRVCVDGKWFATVAKDSSDNEFSCTTKELKDKSGLKIICNGDSIGVVLNGAKGDKGDAGEQGVQGERGIQGEQGVQGEKGDKGDAGEQGLQGEKGEQGIQGKTGKQGEKGDTGDKGEPGDKGDSGKDGASCSIAGQTDSTVTIKCGEKSVVLNLGGKGSSGIVDTLELDSEKIAISLDTLTGFSQKGPFLKGSSVYLYELSDGRTLKQTNGNFTSVITSDDGRYTFQSRDLVSQYALIVVDGKYRNEVTGKPTSTNIKLQAYTNMLMHKSANVNLLTHLEKDRVFYLVTKKGMTVRAAKKQAQAEIFKQFHIDASGFKSESEDLDVFGKTDADAALLAISILLQGADDETALSVLLTEISSDMEKDGLWNEDSAAATKAAIADWNISADGMLARIRSYVTGWGLGGGNVPAFEKYVRQFYGIELGLGVCGSDSVPVGMVKHVTNANSRYYAKSYTDTTRVGGKSVDGKIRFICVDADSARWRFATNIEKDRYGWKPKNTKDGSLLNGPVTGEKMVWDADTLRYANSTEIEFGLGCTSYNKGKFVTKVAESEFGEYGYLCESEGVISPEVSIQRDESKFGTLTDDRDGKKYYTIKIGTQTWMAENLNFDYKVDGVSYGNVCNFEKDDDIADLRTYSLQNNEDCSRYGRFYQWGAAMDSAGIYSTNGEGCGNGKTCTPVYPVRGVCPKGWHLPDSLEWQALYDAVGGSAISLELKGNLHWTGSTDDYGFSAIPNNVEEYLKNHPAYNQGENQFFSIVFWAASELTKKYSDFDYSSSFDFTCSPEYYASYVIMDTDWFGINPYAVYKTNNNSVRCVKDSD